MRTPILVLGLLLAMSPGALAQSVGVASAVNQAAVGTAPGQAARTLYLGDQIIHNQKIATDGKGLLQILLADGTSFTVGPSSSLTIDSFVYDPDKGTAKVVATLGTGLFRFIGGATSKNPDGATLNTPVGTVGILGGIGNFDFSGHGPYHADLLFGNKLWWSKAGKILNDVHKSGYSLVFDNGKVSIIKTPPQWNVNFQTLLAGHGNGKVSGTQVAGLTHTNHTGPNTNNNNPGPNTQGNVPPPVGPVATWAQINNSDLAGVNARYDGTYSADLSYTTAGSHPHTLVSGPVTNDFSLTYDFAPRTGVASFKTGLPIISTVNVPVDATSMHDATFGNSVDSTSQYHVPFFGTAHVTDQGSIQGLFVNTDAGVAHGVVGTFDYTHSDSLLGTLSIDNGAFSGNYTGNVSPPSY